MLKLLVVETGYTRLKESENWVGVLVNQTRGERDFDGREREKIEGGVKVGLTVLSEIKLVMCIAHDLDMCIP